ncbi:hypothetical protein ABDI30_16230 [Paenibacillus cisolokensis]
MNTQIGITVKTVPHPNPQRLVDIWSQIVLKELLHREQENDEKDDRQ